MGLGSGPPRSGLRGLELPGKADPAEAPNLFSAHCNYALSIFLDQVLIGAIVGQQPLFVSSFDQMTQLMQ